MVVDRIQTVRIVFKTEANVASQYDRLYLRVLHSENFNFKHSLELMKKNFAEVRVAFKKPIIFDDRTSKVVNQGIGYIFGRDE